MYKLAATLCLSAIALSCYAGGAKLNIKMKGCKAKPTFGHFKPSSTGSANDNQQQQQQRKKKNQAPPPADWPWWLPY